MLAGEGERLKGAYQQAFEETFVEDYLEWNDALISINSLIDMINVEFKQKYEKYSYNAFCCLAKKVIDDKINGIDWEQMVFDESQRMQREIALGIYEVNSRSRIRHHVQSMEREVLYLCFVRAIKDLVDERVYSLLQDDIEEFNPAVVA